MHTLRRFMNDDLNRVHKIASISLKERYPPELYLTIYRSWSEGFIVAEANGEVVGFICGIKEDEMTSRVLILAVHPLHRNRGIGSDLLKHFIEISSNFGANKVILEVRVNNSRTILFYKKRGFKVVDRLEHFYTDGQDGYRMTRYL